MLIASVTDIERVLAADVEIVLDVDGNSVKDQYSGLMPILHPEKIATARVIPRSG